MRLVPSTRGLSALFRTPAGEPPYPELQRPDRLLPNPRGLLPFSRVPLLLTATEENESVAEEIGSGEHAIESGLLAVHAHRAVLEELAGFALARGERRLRQQFEE